MVGIGQANYRRRKSRVERNGPLEMDLALLQGRDNPQRQQCAGRCRALGVPDVTFYQGSELIYIETQESWKIAYFAEGGAGIDTLHKRFVLSLSFDIEDILSKYEYETTGDNFGDCTRHGICLGQANTVMRYADAVTNATAKEFTPIEERCSIYLHGPGNKKAYEVSLDSKIPVNMFSTGAFIQWMVKPGRHSVVIWPESAFLDFDCVGGEIVFLHFDYRWTQPSKLQMENQLIGREHISNLRLALLPTGSEINQYLAHHRYPSIPVSQYLQ